MRLTLFNDVLDNVLLVVFVGCGAVVPSLQMRVQGGEVLELL